MKDELTSKIKKLTLTPEQRLIILRLNKHFPNSLAKKSEEYFAKESKIQEKEISEAFMINYHERFLDKTYRKTLFELNQKITEIDNISKKNQLLESTAKDEDFLKFEQTAKKLNNTLENVEFFFLWETKKEILEWSRQYHLIETSKENKKQILAKISELSKKIELICQDENLFVIDSLNKDYKFLSKLNENISEKVFFNFKKIWIVIFGFVVIILLIIFAFLFLF